LDQSLPALRLGNRRAQRLLYALPCYVAICCSLLTIWVDWRVGLILLAIAGAWTYLRCPRQRPRLLLHRGGDVYELRLLSGARWRGTILPGAVFAYRLLVLRLQAENGARITALAWFPPEDPRWRRWRVHARRLRLGEPSSRDAAANAAAAPPVPENLDRNDSHGIRGAARPLR